MESGGKIAGAPSVPDDPGGEEHARLSRDDGAAACRAAPGPEADGDIYLHCDPTASHYLKLFLDAVFGPRQFRNEIIWKRTSAHSDAKRYGSSRAAGY